MMDSVGRFAAGFASTGLLIAMAAAAMWLALKTAKWLPKPRTETGEMGVGCFLMLLWFLALCLLFYPSIHVLKSYSCGKAKDYELCMDPPERDWM